MAVDSFWDKREAAQKVVEECAGLRKRIEPLRTAEKQLGDLQLMAELGAEEDEATQTALAAEVTADGPLCTSSPGCAAISARSGTAPRSSARTPDSAPPKRPMGVRV